MCSPGRLRWGQHGEVREVALGKQLGPSPQLHSCGHGSDLGESLLRLALLLEPPQFLPELQLD